MTPGSWSPPRQPVSSEWLEQEFRPDLASVVSGEEREIFDRTIGHFERDVVLYGAGNLGRRVLRGLRNVGVEPVAFADSSVTVQGTEIDGIAVLDPAVACRQFGERAVFVVAVWSPSRANVIGEILQSLRQLGAAQAVSFVSLFWRYAEEFLPYFPLDSPHRVFNAAPEILDAYRLFEDELSLREFRVQLSYLLSLMDTFDIPRGGNASYFPNDLMELSSREVFIDCGAYDGDTLESFVTATAGQFGAVVAFEPDPLAADQLRLSVLKYPPAIRERVRIEQAAVGASAGSLNFEAGGTPGSRISDSGSLSVEVVALDEALRELSPTFIKMDIEGAEEGALLGAARTIRVHRPILAICVYHLQPDLHRIPRLIRQLADDYRLFLRRQGGDGDLVCYAVPIERLRDGARS